MAASGKILASIRIKRLEQYHDNFFVWLMVVVALCSCFGFCQAASLVQLVVGDSLEPPNYLGQMAAFGNQAPQNLFAHNLNLILPPANRSQLCTSSYPGAEWDTQQQQDDPLMQNVNNEPSLVLEEDDSHLIAREKTSVALFVSYGECLPSRKAKVALGLRRNFPQYGTVTHLVIYNNDYSKLDELHTLTSYIHDEDDFTDMTIIFISTRSGRDIMESVKQEERRQRIASPILFAEGNEFWYMPVAFIEPPRYEQYSNSGTGFSDIDPYSDNFGDQGYPPPPQDTGSIPESDDFYWFRMIVFSLLVVSPCFRAAYLWYAGGARIRFRYNEQGRIVGLQYSPPIPYWFAPRPDENYANPATRMTREQVLALPEIVFETWRASSEENNNTSDRQVKVEMEDESAPDVVSENNLNKRACQGHQLNKTFKSTADGTDSSGIAQLSVSLFECGDQPSDALISVDNEQQQPALICPSEMHSTCSICIDDFEQGELLRLLPRCRHIFHTDCILPWLTERQGCCPLCKREVMEPNHDGVGAHSSDSQNMVNQGGMAQQRSVGSVNEFRNEGQQHLGLDSQGSALVHVTTSSEHPRTQRMHPADQSLALPQGSTTEARTDDS